MSKSLLRTKYINLRKTKNQKDVKINLLKVLRLFKNFDYKKNLLKERKVNKDFLEKIKFLTLEELIYLKLDSVSQGLKGKLYGFPMLKFITEICKEALATYALSTTKNKKDAAMILNINKTNLNQLIEKYKIDIKK